MTVDEAKKALGLENDSQLADFLKIRTQATTYYRRIGRLPKGREAIIKLHLLEMQVAATQQATATAGV